MRTVLDIVDKVVPIVIKRMANEGTSLKEILEEELEKEKRRSIKNGPLQQKNTLL